MHSLTLLVAGFLAVSFAAAAETCSSKKKVVCYYANWSVYRKGKGEFHIDDIDTSLCTHFIYRNLLLKGNNVVSSNPCVDLPNGGGKDGFKLFTQLRRKNPSAKFLVSIGEWGTDQSSEYSNMVSTQESRRHFIENVVAFLKTHEFDGADVNWEYPTFYGGKPTDRENFTMLLKEMRERFDQEGLLLTILTSGSHWVTPQAYNISGISKYVDFVNFKAFGYRGSWQEKTGHHAALRGETLSVESTVKYWLDHGLSKEKLVLGVATFGLGWTLSNSKNNTVGAPARGGSTKGPYTEERGHLAYNEICEMIGKGGWSLKFDEKAQAPYAIKGDQWFSYENLKSVIAKAEFIKNSGLGGAMIRTLDLDDFRGICGETYPILRSLNAVLRHGKTRTTKTCTQASIYAEY